MTAHSIQHENNSTTTPQNTNAPITLDKTVFLIKFTPDVMAREKRFN